MILNPRIGDRVQAWYGKQARGYMPLHGRIGTVLIPCRGRPRNHGVMLDGEDVVRAFPCGNLRVPQELPPLLALMEDP